MTREEAIVASEYARIVSERNPDLQEFARRLLSALRAQQDRDRNSTMIVAKLREFASVKPPVCEWDKDNQGPVYCKLYKPWKETARDAADIIVRYEKEQNRRNQVVRCKECKKSKRGGTGYVWCGDRTMPLDGFCSEGKPKEGDGHG